jgi:hypothetical protein
MTANHPVPALGSSGLAILRGLSGLTVLGNHLASVLFHLINQALVPFSHTI